MYLFAFFLNHLLENPRNLSKFSRRAVLNHSSLIQNKHFVIVHHSFQSVRNGYLNYYSKDHLLIVAFWKRVLIRF